MIIEKWTIANYEEIIYYAYYVNDTTHTHAHKHNINTENDIHIGEIGQYEDIDLLATADPTTTTTTTKKDHAA
jgi:hypothetical protein